MPVQRAGFTFDDIRDLLESRDQVLNDVVIVLFVVDLATLVAR
jgi:hypothetical protein